MSHSYTDSWVQLKQEGEMEDEVILEILKIFLKRGKLTARKEYSGTRGRQTLERSRSSQVQPCWLSCRAELKPL